MRFSIITITFNAEEFLEKTLASVATQDFSDYEHIIWDGGSVDRTLKIADKYDVRVYQGKDAGIADAMNKGAAFAEGEILLYLHADDFLAHPSVLSMVDTAFRQHPSLEWLYGQIYTVDERGEVVAQSKYCPFSYKKLRCYNIISHPSTFVKRELFERIGGFNPTLRYCMDYDLWLRLARFSTPLALHAPLACFRKHKGSLSTAEPVNVADEAYRVRNQHVQSLWEHYKSYRTWKKRREKACS
ncbi:MAG: glycosyltransferase family 2 protein [Chlamydiales bacterium]